MAQITWRNVSTFGDKSSSKHVSSAERILSKGFDSFNKVVTDQQDIRQENFDNTTKQNDLGIRANIEQLNDLAALNKEKPNFAIASLKKKYGVQFTADEVDKFVNKQQGELRDKAYGVASQIGGQAANEAADVFTGGDAVYQSLIDQGMAADEAKLRSNQWVQGSQMLQGKFTKEKTDNTDALISGINQSDTQPTSLEDVRKRVIEAGEQYGNRVDLNKATKTIQNALRDRQTDAERLRDENEYQRKEEVRKQVNIFGSQFRAELSETGSFDGVMKTMAGIKNQDVFTQLASQIIPALRAHSKMSPEQELEFKRLENDMAQQTEQIITANANQRAILNKRKTDAQGFSQETEDYVTNLAVKGKNFVKAVTESSQGEGWLTRVVNGKVKHNKDAIQAVNTVYQRMLTQDKLPPKIAQTILFQTINDNVGPNQNFMFEGEGIDTTALSKKLAANIKTYRDSKIYRDDLITFDENAAKDAQTLKYQTSNNLLDHIQLSRMGNLGATVDPTNSALVLQTNALQIQADRENTRNSKKKTEEVNTPPETEPVVESPQSINEQINAFNKKRQIKSGQSQNIKDLKQQYVDQPKYKIRKKFETLNAKDSLTQQEELLKQTLQDLLN